MERLRMPSSQGSTSSTQASYATERARIMLGCYRKGEANDPKIYGATVAAILARYSKAVIDAVTDPVRGLPVQTDFMPTPKEIREACEREALRLERMDEFRAMPKPLPRIENGLRGRQHANLFVPDLSVKFPSLFDRHTAAGDATPCSIEEKRLCKDGVVRRGIWVPMDWYERPIVRPPAAEPKAPPAEDFVPFDDEAAA